MSDKKKKNDETPIPGPYDVLIDHLAYLMKGTSKSFEALKDEGQVRFALVIDTNSPLTPRLDPVVNAETRFTPAFETNRAFVRQLLIDVLQGIGMGTEAAALYGVSRKEAGE